MEKQIERCKIVNNLKCYSIARTNFFCAVINIPTSGEWMNGVKAKAAEIEAKLNAGQANSSKVRDEQTIKIDNLSGLIAEHACRTFLETILGNGVLEETSSETARNQIDIVLAKSKKTIEVRSSCVRNGIEFALFAKPKRDGEEQYFDILGPYSNGYKPGEIEKDFYMRVLYEGDKKNFLTLLEEPVLTLYITGGATRAMMDDKSIYQVKHLIPAGGQVEIESDYRVIPLGKSLDIDEFMAELQKEM